MKKLAVLLVLLVFLFSSAYAAENLEVDPLRFIIEYASLFDWSMSLEDAAAYLEQGGFEITQIELAGQKVGLSGTLRIENSDIILSTLPTIRLLDSAQTGSPIDGALMSISISVPTGAKTLKVLSAYAEEVLGKATKDEANKSMNIWNLGGTMLAISKSDKSADTSIIAVMHIDELEKSTVPVSTASFSQYALDAAAEAKSNIAKKREEAIAALPPFEFRNGIKAGMTREQVIAAEGKQPDKEGDSTLTYDNVSVSGFDASLVYSFADEKLKSAGYVLNVKHSFDGDYIDDYNTVKEALTSKYGAPAIDSMDWKNDLYKDDPQEYGMAVASGHLVYQTRWEIGQVTIINILHGDNYAIGHAVLYRLDQAKESAPNTEGL